MIKISSRILFCLLIINTYPITASEKIASPEENYFNALVSLETNDWNNAITNHIADCIAQHLPVICCTTLLTQLRKNSDPRIITLQYNSSWTVFTDNSGYISVLLPVSHSDSAEAKKLLPKFGLSDLKHVISDNVISTIETATTTTDHALLLKQFDQLFIKYRKEQPVPKKHFLVSGHGGTGITIAGIPIVPTTKDKPSSFAQFLGTIELINTELLYIDSCYAGGPNIIILQNELIQQVKQLFRHSSISCMVIVQATTDEVTFGSQVELIKKEGKFVITYNYFKKFFDNVDRYFNEKNRKDLPLKERLTLAKVLEPLYESFPSITKLPSVRLPGSNSFFRPLIVDKIKVITFLDVQRLITQELFHKRFVHPAEPIGSKDIFIGAGIKYALVYPPVLPITISMASQESVALISKIPGIACHIIDSVTLQRPISSINEELGRIFLNPIAEYEIEIGQEMSKKKIVTYSYGESLKAWFVKTIIYYDKDEKKQKLEDVIIVKYASPKLKIAPGYYGELLYKKNGQHYSCYGTAIRSESPIDEKEYWKLATDIFNSSLPSDTALYEATGGGQNRQTIDETVSRLFPRLKFASTLALSEELASMTNDIEADKSEGFSFALKLIKEQLVPFIKTHHSHFAKEHVTEMTNLVKKLIDASLAKKLKPTFKQLIMYINDPLSTELTKYIAEPIIRIMEYELSNLRQYVYAKQIEKVDADLLSIDKMMTLRLANSVKMAIIDDILNLENQTRINILMQNIISEIIAYDRTRNREKQDTQSRINYFFKEIIAVIEKLKNEKTRKIFQSIISTAQTHANTLLSSYGTH